MTDENPRRQRRLRYKGTHPRRFVERYKERDPERNAQELDKVRARGDTPAGTHRPICGQEVQEALEPRPGDVGLDATLGFGGHAQEILPRLRPGGRLIGVDVDPRELPRTEARLRALGFGNNIPLTALALKQAGYDWGLLAFAVGFGGSMVWIGSSAGGAVSDLYPEAKSVFKWVANGWWIALGYVAGFFALLPMLGWHPHEPHKEGAPAAAVEQSH